MSGSLRFCGRDFLPAELDRIRALIAHTDPPLSRTKLSQAVCEALDWRKPDGGLKEMSARVALLRMQRDGLLTLPPPLRTLPRPRPLAPSPRTDPPPLAPLPAALAQARPLRLCLLRPSDPRSRFWNEFVERYHYLRYKPLPGAQLRYFVHAADGLLLALLGCGAAAWKTAPRDRFVGWDPPTRQRNLPLVVNHARYLILPWIRLPSLASHLLACLQRQLPDDWQQRYGMRPVLLETFCETPRFQGTCYRAANWIHLGQTQGRGKLDTRHEYNQPVKNVFVKPLCPDWKSNPQSLAPRPPFTARSNAYAKGARQQSGNPRQVQPNEEDTGHESEPPKRRRTAGIPAVSMDGKDVRGASRQTQDGRRMLVAAIEHGSGLVRGQLEIDSKTNEIPAVRELADAVEISGCTVTVDALHAQHKTARHLLEDCGADYLVTAIKDNQPTLLADLQAMLFGDSPAYETRDKEHGRSDRRRYWVKDLSDSAWEGYAGLYGRRQAIRIERQRQVLKTGASSTEVTYALTSLTADKATAEQLAALVRNHWHIENRLHYVRDFTYDEDRCRVYVRDLPRNLACLTNTAISIVRCQSRFQFLPEANRHFAARPQEALDLLLNPPAR